MRLTPPKKVTFWVAVLLAVIGFVVYALSYFGILSMAWLSLAGVLLLVLAFVLLCLGLTLKGL